MSSQTPRRPKGSDGSNTKVVVAILFVVLMILILGGPIMRSGLEGALSSGEDPGTRRPPRNNDAGKRNGQRRPDRRIAVRFPRACLPQGATDDGLGLIAAAAGDSVRIATPDRRAIARIDARGPVAWSASGRWLATGGAEVWTRLGDRIGVAFRNRIDEWAWSPTSDCLVGIRDRKLLAWGGDARPITRGPVLSFAFSPTGERLAFSTAIEHTEGAGVWLADLRDGEAKLIQRYTAERAAWDLAGWSRADRPILIQTKQPGSGAGAVIVPSPPGTVDECEEELVVARNGRLATFGVSGPPRFLRADRFYRYTAVTCAPNGEFLAAIRVPKGAPASDSRLVLLTRRGDLVRGLTDGAFRDAAPSWGPTGTGLVLARTQLGSKQQLVWFIPEGGSAYSVGVPVEDGSDGMPVIDWSADGPIGHPL